MREQHPYEGVSNKNPVIGKEGCGYDKESHGHMTPVVYNPFKEKEEPEQDDDHGCGDLMGQQNEDERDYNKGSPGGGSRDDRVPFGLWICQSVEQIQKDQEPDIGHGSRYHVCAIVYGISVHGIHKNDQE